jgi:hypothetical protein
MSRVVLRNGQSLLVFEAVSDGYEPTLYVESDGAEQLVLRGREFLTLHLPGARTRGRITQASAADSISFEAEFPNLPDWRLHGEVTAVGDLAPRFDWHMRLTYLGEDVTECRVEVCFEVNDRGVPRWMIPAMFYKHNRPANCVRKYPCYAVGQDNPQEFVSSYWAFRSDRSSCPAVFCWTDNFTSCLATSETFGDGISGLAFKGDGKVTALMLNFPYVEEPVKYSFCREDGTAPEQTTQTMVPRAQIGFTFATYVDVRDLHAYDSLVRDLYNDSEAEANPWMTKQEAEELVAYGLYRRHYDPEHRVLYETCAFDKYFGKGERQVDRPHMHVAWVSGAPYAYALWRYGREHGLSHYADAGVSVLDKIADEGLAPCGMFYPEWTLESGWGTGWNPNPDWIQARTVSEATWFYLRALEFGRQIGLERPNWEAAARSNLDSALRAQREDGNFGSYYNVNSGSVEEWDGAGGLIWIPALLAGASYFGDERYREAALKAGDYYAKFVEDEYIYGAPEDVHLTPTSEDAYNAVIAYVHLYEAAQDARWLKLACSAADLMATFRWIYNTSFSESTILGRYDFRTLGGDIASPSNNHIHNYGLICHPELLRLWQYTGDTYYLSRAADHLACFHQFIAREDGDFNARKGMITEQWFHTDWTHPKGSMLQLAHSWCAGLVLYANAYTREFGDIIIDAESREVYVLDSAWIKSTEEADPDLVLTLVNPSVRDLSLLVRHSKLGLVGRVEVGALDNVRVLIGGLEPKIEVLMPESEMWTV